MVFFVFPLLISVMFEVLGTLESVGVCFVVRMFVQSREGNIPTDFGEH